MMDELESDARGPAPCGKEYIGGVDIVDEFNIAAAQEENCPHDLAPDRCLTCYEQREPNFSHEGHPRFYEIQRELAATHAQKAQAYEGTGEHYANYKAFARWVKSIQQNPKQAGFFYALLRLEEKLSRIQHVMEGAREGDEQVEDTLNDMAIISTIARILYEEAK